MKLQSIFTFLAVLTISYAAIPMPSAHAGLKCVPSKPKLSVKTATTGTKFIRTKSSKDLTKMHGGGNNRNAVVGGLGGGEIGFKISNKFEVTTQGGQSCIRLKRADITFFAKPQIHIASNFGRSSCEHNAVMAHEQGHIRILRKFVREYSPKVKTQLAGSIRQTNFTIGPIPSAQVKQAQEELQKKLMAKVKRYNKKIMPVLGARQKRHDSPKEYARVAAQCKKWNQKFSSDNASNRSTSRARSRSQSRTRNSRR